MPSTRQSRWREKFVSRHRFGIPVGPITTPTGEKGDRHMPPTLVQLPPRAGSMRFTDEDVTAVIDLLRQAQPGQAVRLTDDPDESDNTARRRAELMKEQIESTVGDTPLRTGFKIRGHVLTDGDPEVKEHTSKKSGKTYKTTAYPQNWGAVSLVPISTPDEPTADEREAAAVAAAEGATDSNPDAPAEAQPGRKATEK